MNADKPNRTIEEIFGDKFQNFEVTPSKGFWPRFEKKLRIREFVRFNPGRFNIFYLGAIVAGITAVSILSFNKDVRPDPLVDISISKQIDQAEKGLELIADPPKEKESLSKGSALASEKVTIIESKDKIPVKESVSESKRDIAIESLDIDNSAIEAEIQLADKGIIAEHKLILPAPIAGFSVEYSRGCAPLKVNFINLSMNYDSCMWEFGDGGYTTEKEPVWVFDEDGEFEVKLMVFGNNGQTDVSSSTIEAYPMPLAKFEVNTGDPMLPDEHVMFYNYSENSVEWRWEFGDGVISHDFEPVHQYNKSGSYSVKLLAISDNGCIDSLIITNAFGANSCFLKFPNAFIPNNGGPTGGYYSKRTDIESEVFHPVWSGVTDYNLRIFSRSGVLIFESNDINLGWDGYNRGQKVEPGVYIWKVRGVFKNGDPFVKGGDVTLLPKR